MSEGPGEQGRPEGEPTIEAGRLPPFLVTSWLVAVLVAAVWPAVAWLLHRGPG